MFYAIRINNFLPYCWLYKTSIIIRKLILVASFIFRSLYFCLLYFAQGETNSKLKFDLKSYLKNAFYKGTTINNYNLKALVIVGSFGHPLFAAIHIYIFNMPWDNMALKISAGLICLSLATKDYWPKKLKPLFPFYWHFMLIYNLSFLITLTSLNNYFIKTWFIWDVIMLYILIMLVPNWLIFLIDLTIGVVCAFVIHILFFKGGSGYDVIIMPYNSGPLDILLYISAFAFATFSGLIFSYSNAKGLASEERAKIFKSLAGSIAHELKNPLNAINLVGMEIKDMATNIEKNNQITPYAGSKNQNLLSSSSLQNLTHKISESINNANNIINIILNDLSEKQIYPHEIKYLNPDNILPKILEKYAYKNEDEKKKIKYHQINDKSIFLKIVPERFNYIIFNLLKNALYYSRSDDFMVNIGVEKRLFDGVNYNSVYILDNGPGISSNSISRLFDDFYTSGKIDGTGLGLAFCKRNMLMLGGDIICESEFGKWTKFSLLFPQLSKEDIEMAQIECNRKRILLVDDQLINLLTGQARINKNLSKITCDVARGGREAIDKFINNNCYDLVLMDIQMPEIDGIKASKKIREFNKEVPIIALTSLDKDTFNKLIVTENALNNFSGYLSKSSPERIFYRSITKWFLDFDDEVKYVGEKDEYSKILVNKKILFADDQQINRVLIKRHLESCGAIVVEVSDGIEMINIYKQSLDKEGNSYFDIILTDISMPYVSGDECSLKIREIETSHKIGYHDEIPIIALTGNGSLNDIRNYFNCRLTDYFIKGSNPDLLIKLISIYLIKKPIKINKVDYTKVVRSETSEIVNLNQLILGNHFDREKQSAILQMFIRDIDDFMDKIHSALEINDKKILLSYIHSVKGSAVNIGADRLYYFCKMIETKIKEGDLSNNWFEEMKKIYYDLKSEIKYFFS